MLYQEHDGPGRAGRADLKNRPLITLRTMWRHELLGPDDQSSQPFTLETRNSVHSVQANNRSAPNNNAYGIEGAVMH